MDFTGNEVLAVAAVAADAMEVFEEESDVFKNAKQLFRIATENYHASVLEVTSGETAIVTVDSVDLPWFIETAKTFSDDSRKAKKRVQVGIFDTIKSIQGIEIRRIP